MDSEEEEFLPFSDTDKSPFSPVPERKLKRLRKTNSKKASIDIPSNADETPLLNAVNSLNFEALDDGEKDRGGLEEPDARSLSRLEGLREGFELDTSFDGLDGGESGPDLDFDSVVEEFRGVDKDRSYEMEVEEAREDMRTEEGSEEKQNDLDSDGLHNGKDKTKKKRGKRKKGASDGFHEEEPFSAASNQIMKAKERRDRLKQLRVESQRLLRETRDATFKLAPLVQKPISTVLEKIRKRKLEVSKRSITTNRTSLFGYNSASEFDLESAYVEKTETDYVEIVKHPIEIDGVSDSLSVDGFEGWADHIHKHKTSEKASAGESGIKFRAPVDDTQDLISYSQKSDSKDELPDETPSSPLEEVFAPSLLAMNLKLDSAPPDEYSDEEDNDKENIDPHLHGSVDLSSSPKGDPVKAFVDEEAEEEDDSDNDLGRFQDDEENEDDIDLQELNEMIATEYEEKPIDNEIRNQLHQKWLEQQDAAGTENLLQRLKCSSKQREPSLLDERGDDVSEEDQGEFFDASMESPLPRSVVRMNLKKAKEMICQMFTDKDDIYISSDEEESERRHVRQSLCDKHEDQANFLSPAEDEGSKEIFSLIKKLNGVPDTRKKTKATSHFHMLSMGGSRTTSSKSSFLGRGSKNSLPSLNKNVSSTVRSFVFERDDSRSTISMSEECSESIHRERRPTKIASAKFCKTQIRSSMQNTQTAAAMNTGPSLHEILRCPLQSSHCNRDGMAGKVDAIYTAFKLDKNIVKREPSISVRTV